MIKENYGMYVDGQVVDEKDIATVIAYTDSAVIFTDDAGNIFFLAANDPQAFELGTVCNVSDLQPISNADAGEQSRIANAVKEGA